MNSKPSSKQVVNPSLHGRGKLSDEDLAIIRELFYEKVVPKLQKLHARLGNIDCSFAGAKYRNWVLSFHSVGSGFEVDDIEYDPEADVFDLDP